jgi:hypothetical protein
MAQRNTIALRGLGFVVVAGIERSRAALRANTYVLRCRTEL